MGAAVSNYDSVDFFTDESLLEDPYPYFDHLRSKCPVVATGHYGVVAVSGYDEATEIYRDIETFSSCNSVIGPFATFPVPLEGDDVGGIIERYRDQLPMNEHMVTMDPPLHTRGAGAPHATDHPQAAQRERGVHVAPGRPQLDELIEADRCEFISAYAQPFAMLVVADVLGVPEADHRRFREGFGLLSGTPGEIGPEEANTS
jgi:cytochrome P450